MTSGCRASNFRISDHQLFPATATGRSTSLHFAVLRNGALLLFLALLAACGGGGGSSGGDGGSPGGGTITLLSMTVTPASTTLQVASEVKLAAAGTYSDGVTRDATTSVTWTSSSPRVAIVNGVGGVMARAAGTTTITATSGGVSASATVTVTSSTVNYLHTFGVEPTDGNSPNGPLLLASDGNFYGTTRSGGGNRCLDFDNFCGTLFRLTPGGAYTVMHRFGGFPADGEQPGGPLIQGSDGALYGVTIVGGAHGFGTVFRIALDGTYAVLHSFGATSAAGKLPLGRLVQAIDGNIYGTTLSGGGGAHCPDSDVECGTAFRLSPNGEHVVLHAFGSVPGDGASPSALIQAGDGSFYGTTASGGNLSCRPTPQTSGCGTIFRMTAAGAVTILHSFGSYQGDAILPAGPLIPGGDGAYYGTTYGGGGGACPGITPGCGTVFRITPAGTMTIFYTFSRPTNDGTTSYANGYNPMPYLLRGRDGNFYGVTEAGGPFETTRGGTVFRITPSGIRTTLYAFGPFGDNPTIPFGGLIEGADGALYGVTQDSDRSEAWGTIFRLVP